VASETIDHVAGRLLDRLAARGETVAAAESLTGGLLAARLTDVPGASRSFVGGVVSYATRIKESVLGVPAEVIEAHGVISEECATAMAVGVRDRLDATWGLATTGVAGPDLQEGHPAGTVWFAVAGPGGVRTRQLTLSGTRQEIREGTCLELLSVLDDILIGIHTREEPGLG
jgi:nicotinamide-nucleotide amidase